MFDLTGKVALITGASSGIGRASAIALSSQGAHVVVAARSIDKLNDLVATIVGSGKRAIAVQLDVTDLSQITSAVSKTIETFGRLDILVNNAGALDYTPFLDMPEDKWNLIINTNLKGYFLLHKLLLARW